MNQPLRPSRLVSCGLLACVFACSNNTSAPGGTAVLDIVSVPDSATDVSDGASDAVGDSAAVPDSLGDVTPAETSACPTGKACDDGDKCTTGDKCANDLCKGTPLVCDQGLPPCKQGVCEPGSGLCLISDKDASCDDGDPCTQADNCLLGTCMGFPKPGCCTVSCVGKSCGDDGCGGSCGSCKGGEVCGKGACVASTSAGETCADAQVIASLPFQHAGSTLGKANDLKAPDKACYNGSLGDYGPDVVYSYVPTQDGSVGIHLTGFDNKPAFYVFTDCADVKNSCLGGTLGFGQNELGPVYVPVTKGKAVFIVIDADDKGGDYTLDVSACTPQCTGKVCGTDGCGGVCGYCPKLSAYNCSSAGTCVCVKSCAGKTCGDDGCGGSCGTCGSGDVCDGGIQGAYQLKCVKANQAGDTCANPMVVDKPVYTYSGTTVGLGNNLYGWAFCQGNGTGAYYGSEAPDMVFALGGGKAETWRVELTQAGSNLEIYALTDCKDPVTCTQAGYKGATLKTQLLVEAPTGAALFVAVDGYNDQAGTFTLQAKKCVVPSDCPQGEPGEYCSFPVVIDALPYKKAGSIGIDSYALPKGACGAPKQFGHGGGNRAYAFTASQAGTYTVTVKGSLGMDPIVYAAKDCTKLASTCAGYADKTGENGAETLAIAAKAGEVWYVVVDAPTSVGGAFELGVVGP